MTIPISISIWSEHGRGALHKSYLRKVGGSVMLAVPPAILDLLDLHPSATVGLTVDDGRLVIEPVRRPQYSLDELLARCDAAAEISDEDRAWLDGTRAGGELL